MSAEIPGPVAEGEHVTGEADGQKRVVRFNSDGSDPVLLDADGQMPGGTRAVSATVQKCEAGGGEPAEIVNDAICTATNLGLAVSVPGVVAGEEYTVSIIG